MVALFVMVIAESPKEILTVKEEKYGSYFPLKKLYHHLDGNLNQLMITR